MAATKRNFILSSGIGLSADNIYTVSSSNSTSINTGSLLTAGGAGIAKSLSVGGRLQLFSGSNYTAFVSSASGNTVYTLPANSPATGTSVLQSTSAGVMSWVPMVASGAASGFTNLNGLTEDIQYFSTGSSGSGFNISSSGSTHSFNIPIAGSGSTGLVTTLAQTIAGQKTFTSALYISDTTASTGTSIGALQVAGGVGISGRLSFNQASFGTTGIASNPTIAMIGNTGDPVYISVLEDNSISFEGSQGQLFSITPNLSTGYIYSVNDITGIPLLRANANANITANEFAGNFGIGLTNPGYRLHVSGSVGFTSIVASSSTSTGTLIVSGGVGIGQSVSVGGNLQMFNGAYYTSFVSSASGNTTYTLPATSPATGSSVLSSTSSGVMSWVPLTTGSSSGNTAQNIIVNTAGNANVFHPVLFTPSSLSAGSAVSSDSTISFNPSSEILYVSGLAVTSNTASTNSTSGALTVAGGVGIGGSLYVAGDLTINGTTTTINSVTLTVDDKNIEMGSVASPSDVTAEGGGITLKGTSDKSVNWYTGTGWSSSENFNLASGNTYKIANTSVLTNSSLGVGITNSHLTAVSTITTGTWAGSTITTLYGGTGLSAYTKGDLLVGLGDTLYKLPVGTQGQLLQAFSSATSGLAWTSITAPTYGAFYSTQTQTVIGAGISTPITLNSTYEAYNTQIYGGSGTSSRIQIQTAGTYNIQFSAQIHLSNGTQPKKGDLWFRINGVDVPQSNTENTISGKDYQTVLALNFISYFAANDYFEIVMSSSDQYFQVEAITGLTNPPRPDIPSMIVTVVPVTQVVGSSAGLGVSGIVSLNGLNNYIQYFAVGKTGTDVNITSSSQTHTINIPLAGSGATGLISSQNQTIAGSKTFTNDLIVSEVSASTSPITGAIQVSGGAGIGQSLSIGGRLQLFNGSNYSAFISSATGNTLYTLPASSPATGSSVLSSTAAGVMSWVPMSSSGNTSQNIAINTAGNANVFHPVLLTPSPLSAGSAVSSDSTITFNPSTEILSVSGLAITSGTASTNTTTGAIVVRGGLGVTGQLSFATASFGFTGITTNPIMSFIGATSSSPITLTVLTDNSLSWEGSSGQLFSIDNNLTTGDIFSVSDISGLPIINASAGQTVSLNEFGGFTRIGNGSISSTGASNSAANGTLVVYGGLGVTGEISIGGKLQLFNGSKYAAFVSSSTGNTIYTLPATSPATGTSYLTSTSAGVMSWTAPNKANYVLSFGAGFTPTANSADSVSLNIPYAPDGTSKYYFVKRIEYRNETLSGGSGLSFYLQRHTSGDASWTTNNTLIAGSGASFYVGPSVYASSFTTINSSAGVAGSIISGDYVRLFFTGVGSAANVSIAMTIEEQ